MVWPTLIAGCVLAGAVMLAPPLTVVQLRSFTFDLGDSASVEGGKVPLDDGRWTDPASGTVFSLHPAHALGDLDGDGAADAVAVLVEDTGGAGRFVYLFAVMNRAGAPTQMGPPEWLGDRSVIERVAIDRRGVVSVRYRTHRDGDQPCCPSLRIDDRYRVENGVLIGITK